MSRVIVAIALLVCGDAFAQKRSVRIVWLPTRAHNATTRAEVDRIATEIAGTVGGELAPMRDSAERGPMLEGLERATRLLGDGAVDEAADVYDTAILRGRRTLLELTDASELERGIVARIGIALARAESARARELATWLLRVDPTFAIAPSENRPRLTTELAEARRALGNDVPLSVADLGECHPSPDIIVVVRAIRPDEVELRRLDGCRLRDAQSITIGRDHRAAVRAIVGPDAVAAAAPRSSRETPVYRKAWLWVAIGVVAAGAAGAAYYANAPETREVVPHW